MTVLQQAHQRIQVRGQQIFATEMQDNALADLPAVAIILDQAEISVITAFGLAKEHRGSEITPRLFQHKAYKVKIKMRFKQQMLSLHIWALRKATLVLSRGCEAQQPRNGPRKLNMR
jgi:hypothetical protein